MYNQTAVLNGLCISLLRLVADALNDLSILMNLVAPLFPDVFLIIACFASLCRVSSIECYVRVFQPGLFIHYTHHSYPMKTAP